MGLFDRKPIALAMLGNSAATKMLAESKVFEEYGINLLDKEYVTVEELLQGMREKRTAEFVLLSDLAFADQKDLQDAIVQIREQDDNICIVLFFNLKQPDVIFRNWAYGYKVYHLYTADESGSHDFDIILPELVEKKIPVVPDTSGNKELEAQLSQKQEALDKQSEYIALLKKQLTEKENLTELTDEDKKETEALEQKIREEQELRSQVQSEITELRSEFEAERKRLKEQAEQAQREKEEMRLHAEKKIKEAQAELESLQRETPKEDPLKRRGPGSITIGVFNISRGAGATYTAVSLGEAFAGMGYATAVIAYDGQRDLLYAKKGLADHFIPEAAATKKADLLEVLNSGYTFVIIDFGNVFPLTNEGTLFISDNEHGKRDEASELLRCQYKVGIGFSSPWHISKLKFFDGNTMYDSMSSVFAITGLDEAGGLEHMDLAICDRDDELIQEILMQWLGLERRQLKNQDRKRGTGFFKRVVKEKAENGNI